MIHKSLLLTAIALAPNLSAIPVQTNNSTTTYIQEVDDEEQEQEESCTFMYVGKDVSSTGKAIVARCGDSSPRGMNLNAQIFEHNQLANVVTHGRDGFTWKMPSTTYRYISTPRNPLVKNGLHWEVSAVNENGVCVSATLTCNTNKVAAAADNFVKTGINEDNITQIVGATATSARNGIATIANIINNQGNAGNESFMVMDKDEVWYMELYTGHQYLAIKFPTNKAFAAGNEFSLNTIYELGLGENDYIASKDLLKTAVDGGFAKFDDSGNQTLEHLHLYNTYAGEDEGQGNLANSSHMRTWRARDLFAANGEKPSEYAVDADFQPTEKYSPFWTPAKPMSVNDVITYMRDRYENILDDEAHKEHNKFLNIKNHDGSLRVVGSNTTYQVHIMSINPDLPKELSCEEWIAMSSANYTPFTLVNSGVTALDPQYSHVIQDYGFDENAACCIYKRLNSVADIERKYYGLPIQHFISLHESIWQKQYSDLVPQIKNESIDTQRNVLTNFCLETQKAGLLLSETVYDDLIWHIINPQSDKTFKPFISLQYYGYLYGWDCNFKDNIATLKNGDDTLKVDFHYETRPATGWIVGKISKNDQGTETVYLKTKDGVPFMEYSAAKKYMSDGHEIATINWKDYYTSTNNSSSWIIPVAITVPIVVLVAAIAPVMAISSTRKKKGKEVATQM